MTRIPRGTTAALALAALLVSACVPDSPTPEGRSIGDLYRTFLVIAAVVAAIVWGLLTWSVLRYRRPQRQSDLAPQIHGDLRLEIIWTVIPAITIVALFVLTLGTLAVTEARAPQGAVQLEVRAFRWGWEFRYPEERVAVAGVVGQPVRAVVPVGRPLSIDLTATDVVHAFYVPEFLMKRDAVPGRTVTFGLTIEAPGSYAGQCAEFCGVFHARMPFTIDAVSDAEYRSWLEAQRAVPGVSP